MTEILRLQTDERKELLVNKFRSFQVRVTPKKKYKFVLLIGEGENMHLVCRRGFARAYSVSHWYIEDIITRLKKGHLNCLAELDPCAHVNPNVISDRRIQTFAEDFGIMLTPEQCGSLRLKQSVPSLLCASWMMYYFALVGDQVPNSDHEIHLEPIPKKEVYKEYVYDMEFLDEEPVTLETFLRIWKDVYPYVKVRKYKNSCGHCNLCTTLSEKRRKFRDRAGREEVTNLFALHRMSTMGERRTYYDRRLQASLSPSLFLSTISDGMQQNHCLLPWYGNSKSPGSYHIKQHLQGVYMHGDNMTVFRTFANVGGGANLAIHTWLLSLENYWIRNGHRFPNVIYHQIDGGPENANEEFLAICALLVACRLVYKVVLTRLPVGHTHEDIDGLFALIWRMLRDEHIYTPYEFAKLIVTALKKKVKVNVVDLFCLPDYVSVLEDCIDPVLGRFVKEEWAQLQFTFESVDVSEDHPLGVKTTYRAYAQDSYIEIVEDDKDRSLCGLIPQECTVQSRPLPGEAPLNPLKKLPTTDFAPAPFIAGSRKLVEEVSDRMASHYAASRQSVSDEWTNWAANSAPLSDSAQDYVTTKHGVVPALWQGDDYLLTSFTGPGVYVPFRRRIFGETGVSEVDVEARERRVREGRMSGAIMRQVTSTTCMTHSGNSRAQGKKTPSRLVTQNADGSTPLEAIGVLNNVYPGRGERRESAKQKRAATKAAKDAKKAADDAKEDAKDAKEDANVGAKEDAKVGAKEDAKEVAEDSDSDDEVVVGPKSKKKKPRRVPRYKKGQSPRERAAAKSREQHESEESEEDVNDSDASDDDSDASSHHSDASVDEEPDAVFTNGDVVCNVHNLQGTITACFDGEPNRLYNVLYRDGRTDENVRGKLLVLHVPRAKPKRKAASAKGSYALVVADDWVDNGAVGQSHVITGKRQRPSANYTK
jgi:hypothetical protein